MREITQETIYCDGCGGKVYERIGKNITHSQAYYRVRKYEICESCLEKLKIEGRLIVDKGDSEMAGKIIYSDDELGEALRTCIKEIGKIPTIEEYIAFSKARPNFPSYGTLKNRFNGSFTTALNYAVGLRENEDNK